MADGAPLYVASHAELAQLCAGFDTADTVGLDTEFERSRTYYAELCLVQIAAGDTIACIDPFALDSLAPLSAALAASRAPKLVHAARQDFEILYQLGGSLPAPVVDTQVAAGLAGFADNIGYADLVRQLCGVELDKSQTRTDWRQRPLSAAQLRYAADDVRYLAAVAAHLQARLRELGRETWLVEDCQALTAPATYAQPAANAWQRVKGIATLPAPALARAAALAAWRENTAQARNLPRGWVLRDDELIQIAVAAPADVQGVAAVAGANPGSVRRHAEAILAVLREAGDAHAGPAPARRLTAAGRSLCKTLLARAQAVAGTLGIVPTVLVTRRELEAAVCGETPARLRDGWRAAWLAEVLALVPPGAAGLWEI